MITRCTTNIFHMENYIKNIQIIYFCEIVSTNNDLNKNEKGITKRKTLRLVNEKSKTLHYESTKKMFIDNDTLRSVIFGKMIH